MKFKEALEFWSVLVIKLFGMAALFGVVGYSFNLPILGMCVIGFIINFVLGVSVTYYFNYKHEKLVAEQNRAILDYQSKKTAKVQCAYCHAENIVPIDLSNTKFICPRCKKQNRLIAEFTAAQITVPQSTDDMIGRAVQN